MFLSRRKSSDTLESLPRWAKSSVANSACSRLKIRVGLHCLQ